MRKEIENWWKQAKDDIDKARIILDNKKYDGAAFFSQQAAEKALKALILYKTKEKIEGHSLVYLGKKSKIPPKFFSGLKKLSPQYFLSRYPDVTEDVPYELYDEELARELFRIAEDLLKWIEKQLK